MIAPSELTGAQVRAIREEHKISAKQFYDLCGFEGKSTARLANIEKKDSWKPGDREKVANAINSLLVSSVTNGRISVAPAPPAPDPISPPPDPEPTPIFDSLKSDDDSDNVVFLHDPNENDEWDEDSTTVVIGGVEEEQIGQQNDNVLDLGFMSLPQDLQDEAANRKVMELSSLPPIDDDEYVITNGQLQTAKRCLRKWWLAWYRKLALREQKFTGALATGTRVHRALQAWYVPEGQQRVDPRDALERALLEDWTAVVNAAQERGHDEFVIENLKEEFKQAASLERAMIEGYVEWLEEGHDAELKVIAPETVISKSIDVVRPNGEKVPITLKGLIDVRAVRTTDNAKLFIDHKTCADLKSPMKTIHMNEQMLHYHLIEWLSLEGEERCDGALYNMLRKVKRTARAQPPFYGRVEVRHNDYELESYKRQMLATTNMILDKVEQLDAGADHHDVVPPTRNGNCSWDCDFFAICPMFDDGSRVEDALATIYHEVDPHDRYEPRQE